jgi:predicted NBD/HSP70 family sugar kinase
LRTTRLLGGFCVFHGRSRYKELVPKSRAATIHDLLRLTEEGDPDAIAAVTRQATHLGRGLRLVTAALSSEVILITGDITTSWIRFGPVIQRELENIMLAGAALILGITKDGELSRLRGAAAVVLQRHSGSKYRLHQLNVLTDNICNGAHFLTSYL